VPFWGAHVEPFMNQPTEAAGGSKHGGPEISSKAFCTNLTLALVLELVNGWTYFRELLCHSLHVPLQIHDFGPDSLNLIVKKTATI